MHRFFSFVFRGSYSFLSLDSFSISSCCLYLSHIVYYFFLRSRFSCCPRMFSDLRDCKSLLWLETKHTIQKRLKILGLDVTVISPKTVSAFISNMLVYGIICRSFLFARIFSDNQDKQCNSEREDVDLRTFVTFSSNNLRCPIIRGAQLGAQKPVSSSTFDWSRHTVVN